MSFSWVGCTIGRRLLNPQTETSSTKDISPSLSLRVKLVPLSRRLRNGSRKQPWIRRSRYAAPKVNKLLTSLDFLRRRRPPGSRCKRFRRLNSSRHLTKRMGSDAPWTSRSRQSPDRNGAKGLPHRNSAGPVARSGPRTVPASEARRIATECRAVRFPRRGIMDAEQPHMVPFEPNVLPEERC